MSSLRGPGRLSALLLALGCAPAVPGPGADALAPARSAAVAPAADALPAAAGDERTGSVARHLYFPPPTGPWEMVDPASLGWDLNALEAALAYVGTARSSGVVVLHDGRLVAERYWPVASDPSIEDRYEAMVADTTADGRAIEDVASMQKTIVSFLAGVAEGKGLLEFDAPVSRYLGAGWSKATASQEAAITVRHVLGMTSGLTEELTFEAPPGETWMYNSPVYSKAPRILEQAAGMTVARYTAAWLTEPIGMSESGWRERAPAIRAPWGNDIGFTTTARDLARFGILSLARGFWQGRDVLGNRTYFERALRPSQPQNASYGLLWWLNDGATLMRGRKSTEVRSGPLIPKAPPDLFAAEGALQRKLYVVPSRGLVIVRLGAESRDNFNHRFWELFAAALPASD